MSQPISVVSPPLLAELLTKDTESRSAKVIAELIESIGGSLATVVTTQLVCQSKSYLLISTSR